MYRKYELQTSKNIQKERQFEHSYCKEVTYDGGLNEPFITPIARGRGKRESKGGQTIQYYYICRYYLQEIINQKDDGIHQYQPRQAHLNQYNVKKSKTKNQAKTTLFF
eukprot:TRINITY_DN54799_c0_g1_i2.p3 TRINITY_DN54799_c0_g1~~TRINITY_DN54799_c0_g1_i2.p3  ORF type:complete len:108 (-),score=7.27 TRINITY_DN54799_c0_g1_i2:400-723(-)